MANFYTYEMIEYQKSTQGDINMEIRSECVSGTTLAFIKGEIDHHNAKEARSALDGIIERDRPITFKLELSGVSFCDSSGLGLVMGRMRKCQSVGSNMVVRNPSPAAMRILEIAGMDKIIKIEREN
ncbi:MAG: STAS domain-containing protein [Ruminococcaceae bacterium]|nr:STAS domain-containing protein [Oscillospiraceae bacterium]